MKKVLNKYSVWRNGQCWLSDIANYEGVVDTINYILDGLRFTPDEVEITITRAYIDQGGNVDDVIAYEKFKRGYWFKSNRYGIIAKAVATNEVVETERFDELDNQLLRPVKPFNGKGLKRNSIEPPSKFKLGAFHDPDTWFALSVFRNKGWSTLGREKKKKDPNNAVEIADKLDKMPDYSAWDRKPQASDTIKKLLGEGLSGCEVRRRLKPQFVGRQSELKKLIYELNG